MPQSLEMFHFNPVKFGLIAKQSAKEKGISQASMAARTGLSYDTVGNIYTGKIQKFAFEHVFKICVVLGMSLEVMELLLLKDEEIDFMDGVLLYDTAADDVVPVQDVLPSMTPGPVTDTVMDTAIEATEKPKDNADIPYGFYTKDEVMERVEHATKHLSVEIDHLRSALKSAEEKNERHISDLKEQHRKHIDDLKEQHQNERATGEKHREWMLSVIASSLGKANR